MRADGTPADTGVDAYEDGCNWRVIVGEDPLMIEYLFRTSLYMLDDHSFVITGAVSEWYASQSKYHHDLLDSLLPVPLTTPSVPRRSLSLHSSADCTKTACITGWNAQLRDIGHVAKSSPTQISEFRGM